MLVFVVLWDNKSFKMVFSVTQWGILISVEHNHRKWSATKLKLFCLTFRVFRKKARPRHPAMSRSLRTPNRVWKMRKRTWKRSPTTKTIKSRRRFVFRLIWLWLVTSTWNEVKFRRFSEQFQTICAARGSARKEYNMILLTCSTTVMTFNTIHRRKEKLKEV